MSQRIADIVSAAGGLVMVVASLLGSADGVQDESRARCMVARAAASFKINVSRVCQEHGVSRAVFSRKLNGSSSRAAGGWRRVHAPRTPDP